MAYRVVLSKAEFEAQYLSDFNKPTPLIEQAKECLTKITCGCGFSLEVETHKYLTHRKGELVQNVFTELDPDSRELLIRGMCGKCFDKMFES